MAKVLLDKKSVKGYVTYFFDTSKYMSLEDILNLKPREYARLSFEKRFLLVRQLCEALLGLDKMSFIHADINAQNILINLENLHLIIIDFDSGAVTSGDDFIPATFGKLNEWVAPEIREQISKNPKTVKVNIHSDRFSAIVGIHYLLFMQPPYCFVTSMSNDIMRHYLQKYGWSNSPDNSEVYFKGSFPAYSKMVQYLKINKKDFFRALEVSLNQGYFDINSRVTYNQFLLKIKSSKVIKKSISSSKQIKRFKLNRDTIFLSLYIFIFGYIFSLGYYFLFDGEEKMVDKVVAEQVVLYNIHLHDAYISNNYLLGFSNIKQLGSRLSFSYSLIKTSNFHKQKGDGYIDLRSLKLYLNGLDDIGEVKKDGNAILFKRERFI